MLPDIFILVNKDFQSIFPSPTVLYVTEAKPCFAEYGLRQGAIVPSKYRALGRHVLQLL